MGSIRDVTNASGAIVGHTDFSAFGVRTDAGLSNLDRYGFQGEQWHQNHHDRPGSARLGYGSNQLDVGWLTIVMLEKVGLAKDVRRPDLREEIDVAA